MLIYCLERNAIAHLTITHEQACIRSAASVDDEDVTVRATLHRCAHAVAEYPLEEAGFTRAYHDEIGASLLGEPHDGLCRIADAEDRVSVDAALGQLVAGRVQQGVVFVR